MYSCFIRNCCCIRRFTISPSLTHFICSYSYFFYKTNSPFELLIPSVQQRGILKSTYKHKFFSTVIKHNPARATRKTEKFYVSNTNNIDSDTKFDNSTVNKLYKSMVDNDNCSEHDHLAKKILDNTNGNSLHSESKLNTPVVCNSIFTRSVRRTLIKKQISLGKVASIFDCDDGNMERRILEESLLSEHDLTKKKKILRLLEKMENTTGPSDTCVKVSVLQPPKVLEEWKLKPNLSELTTNTTFSDEQNNSQQMNETDCSNKDTFLELNVRSELPTQSIRYVPKDRIKRHVLTSQQTSSEDVFASSTSYAPATNIHVDKNIVKPLDEKKSFSNSTPNSNIGYEDNKLLKQIDAYKRVFPSTAISSLAPKDICAFFSVTDSSELNCNIENGIIPIGKIKSHSVSRNIERVPESKTNFMQDVKDDATSGNIISELKIKALQLDTKTTEFLGENSHDVITYFPGIERQKRRREMLEYSGTLEDLIKDGKASIENVNLLLKAMCLQGKLSDALNSYDMAITLGFRPNAETFVSLIQGATQLKDPSAARMIYLKMRSQLISPTVRVYGALIHAHTHAGDIASGFSLLNKMETERFIPDVVIYTTLIDALVMAKQHDEAWSVFREMRTWKLLEPDEVLFTVMIKSCAMQNEPEKALGLLDDLRCSNLYPTDITYTELIHACCADSHFYDKAFEFANQMEAEDMPITLQVYEHLLKACSTQGDVKRAGSIAGKIRDANLQLSMNCYIYLIDTLSTWVKPRRASKRFTGIVLKQTWDLVTQMQTVDHFQLSTTILNSIQKLYITAGYYQYAVDMLKLFNINQAEPNIDTYGNLLNMFAKSLNDPGRFFNLWTFLRQKTSLLPSSELFHLTVHMAINSNSATQVVATLEDMYSVKVLPSVQLTTRLSKVGRHIPELTKLMQLFIKLQQREAVTETKLENNCVERHIEEHELRQYERGRTTKTLSPEDEVRKEYFNKKEASLPPKNRRLPYHLFKQLKKEGGEYFHLKMDKPPPNPHNIKPIYAS